MRVAVIADIHANLVALQAVLADLAGAPPDGIVCLGDVAATGPQPRETISRLRDLGCPVVMGNADAWMLDPPATVAEDEETRRIEEIDRWNLEQLAPDDLASIRRFRPTVEVDLGTADGGLLCFHGSPRSNTEVIEATTPEEALVEALAGARATILAGGHTHVPLVRRVGDAFLLNPGSVGLPRTPPWADYAVVEATADRLGIELRHVRLDGAAVRRAALTSGMPHADWWAGHWP